MRKGFDCLCGVVRQWMGRDPLSGEVFVFVNGDRNLIKHLHWEHGGFVIYHKRLERGRLSLPKLDEASGSYQLPWPELVFMVGGYSFENIWRERRYDFPLKSDANNCRLSW
jgi:hypothetical protein